MRVAFRAFLMAAIAVVSISSEAATLFYTGQVTDSTGAISALLSADTQVNGFAVADDAALAAGLIGAEDLLEMRIQIDQFCFTSGNGGCGVITSFIQSYETVNITGTEGVLGGELSFTAINPTFQILLSVTLDLSAGTFLIDGGLFGSMSGDAFLEAPVPVPAAFWLLGSALLGLVHARRRN